MSIVLSKAIELANNPIIIPSFSEGINKFYDGGYHCTTYLFDIDSFMSFC